MRNNIVLIAVLLGLSFSAYAGNLVFEAEEEEEIIIVEETSSFSKKITGGVKASKSRDQKIRCQFPDGRYYLLDMTECKRKQMAIKAAR